MLLLLSDFSPYLLMSRIHEAKQESIYLKKNPLFIFREESAQTKTFFLVCYDLELLSKEDKRVRAKR